MELTLALLLFADASTVQLRKIEGDARVPSRLLSIGLPLIIAVGTVIAVLLFPAAGWAAAALIASILAPTDSVWASRSSRTGPFPSGSGARSTLRAV